MGRPCVEPPQRGAEPIAEGAASFPDSVSRILSACPVNMITRLLRPPRLSPAATQTHAVPPPTPTLCVPLSSLSRGACACPLLPSWRLAKRAGAAAPTGAPADPSTSLRSRQAPAAAKPPRQAAAAKPPRQAAAPSRCAKPPAKGGGPFGGSNDEDNGLLCTSLLGLCPLKQAHHGVSRPRRVVCIRARWDRVAVENDVPWTLAVSVH